MLAQILRAVRLTVAKLTSATRRSRTLFRAAHPQVIKPLVALARSSVCDALVGLGAAGDNGRPYAAPATVFISHAWGYLFAKLLAALEAFALKQRDPAGVYMWLVSGLISGAALRLNRHQRDMITSPLPP